MLERIIQDQKVGLPPPPMQRQQRARGVAELTVKSVDERSHIDRLYQQGCAKIRIPQSTRPDIEAIMINSSGGLTGGDRVDWTIRVKENASATITTQACERVYKSVGGSANTTIKIDVEDGSKLSWLPQETILFNQGNLKRNINVDIADSSEVLIIEPLIIGRQAMGEDVADGQFQDSWRIFKNGALFHSEEFHLGPCVSDQLAGKFTADDQRAMATVFFMSPLAESHLSTVRTLLGESGGASFWNGKLIARLVAKDGYLLRQNLVPLIKLLNFQAHMPKVWSL